MFRIIIGFSFILLLISCKEKNQEALNNQKGIQEVVIDKPGDFTLVFASCADQERPQPLWDPINALHPDLFVWGGDNIYADTADMAKMEADYEKLSGIPGYAELATSTMITGTWDDHDYGKNDAGKEWEKKAEAQELFLDFLKASPDDVRRSREGVYTAELYETEGGSINLILLDTRTFRDALKFDPIRGRKYQAWPEDTGYSVLGEQQWAWLEETLNNSQADFNLIVSSIQFLSDEHGWEKWGNFPNEVSRMYELLQASTAKNIIILSGDRHMAEVSVNPEAGLSYPLVDFTSSGMTHTWIDGSTESNRYRVSNVIKRLNFGLLTFDFSTMAVIFELIGEDGFVYERYIQQY